MKWLSTGLVVLMAACAGRPEPPPPEHAIAGVESLSWLTGRWVSAAEGNYSEETWSPPEGDCLIGMWRWIRDGEARIYELLTISEEADGLVLRLRHFDRKGIAWEEKDAPLVLRQIAAGANFATFEGRKEGNRLRITYRRDDEDALSSLVETIPPEGEKKVQRYEFRRAFP